MSQKQNYIPKIQYTKYTPVREKEYNMLFFEHKSTQEKNYDKIKEFKQRLSKFKTVNTLEEARQLLNKIMPVSLERTTFYIGSAKVLIINREDQLRICFKSARELISYDFV